MFNSANASVKSPASTPVATIPSGGCLYRKVAAVAAKVEVAAAWAGADDRVEESFVRAIKPLSRRDGIGPSVGRITGCVEQQLRAVDLGEAGFVKPGMADAGDDRVANSKWLII